MGPWSRISHATTTFAGSGKALGILGAFFAAWVVLGAATGWPHWWELTITIGAPFLTLVLVVILQHAENRNSQALHVKLNELLLALDAPDEDVMSAQDRDDDELDELEDRYNRVATASRERRG